MAEADEQFILNEEALDDLYAWIDTIPLSRPKKNIARDFSDGVLCAEAVSYFKPKLVDIHNYFAASSVMQKKTNWNTLNRKVFQKIGLRLTDATIQQLVEAMPGAIEQVLWDVRQKVQGQDQPSSRQAPSRQNEQRPNNHVQQQHRPKTHNPAPNTTRPATGYGIQEQQREYHDDMDYFERTSPAVASSSRGTMGYQSQGTGIPVPGSIKDRPQTPGYKSFGGAQPEVQSYQGQGNNHGQSQGYVVQPQNARRTPSTSLSESGNNNSALAPTQILYRGHKMVSMSLLEEKEREIKGLEQANKNLSTKIVRIETLVNVKDQRIEDLTHQLHNLRNLYERTTQQTAQGY